MSSESKKYGDGNDADLDDTCVTCHQYFDKEDECWGNYVPLTRDEETILAQMRGVKQRVAEVKRHLNDFEGRKGFEPLNIDAAEGSGTEEQAEWLEQKKRLQVLRREWLELDRKRQEAARFRMKILGHED
jgi:hypothetical protein